MSAYEVKFASNLMYVSPPGTTGMSYAVDYQQVYDALRHELLRQGQAVDTETMREWQRTMGIAPNEAILGWLPPKEGKKDLVIDRLLALVKDLTE